LLLLLFSNPVILPVAWACTLDQVAIFVGQMFGRWLSL